ncbi:50S ribosomal protein L25 [Bacillus coahuilensis m2-6]|uniref:Large ribosomal subunit protein bL25 n=1 Tax=Bacillus coahuilensis p1.1.43 TaxID=1150625 RepID=A0A147K4X4_9BACI|nr:50S ribosomal protein L25/general stress protein Ctc [Bacillus coahuilensis]KUP04219.1 50S ribosomal protein L25 [Bacillus coahuilensis m2-6]KUP04559.1 50S ribosomal protein L25 [Bacillus coahuilensis p1.1.43]
MSNQLTATKREGFKRSDLTSLRNQGSIPAVVYGHKMDSTSIMIDEPSFIKTMREVGRNGIINLLVDGNKTQVVLTDYQRDPIKDEVVHADFLAINMSEDMEASVRIDLVGDAAGVKDGGVMQQPLHEISVTAKPQDFPDSIKVDVENLQVGETITVGDIRQQFSYELNLEDDVTVASILAPRQEEEINSGEEQEGGHPTNEEGRETEPVGSDEE